MSKIKEILKNNSLTKQAYYNLKFKLKGNSIKDTPLPYIRYKFDMHFVKSRLTLIVPTWEKATVFGGLSTALKFFNQVADELVVDKRIIVLYGKYDPKKTYQASGYYCTGKDKNVYFVEDGEIIPIAKNDYFMGTYWSTVYCIQPVIKLQKEKWGLKDRKLLYLIQDYEPGFSPWSTDFYLSESTYKTNAEDIIAIFNSEELYEYFKNNGYKFAKELFFKPELNDKLKVQLKSMANSTREKKILIYGRPSKARNAFGLIRSALSRWSEVYPNANQWRIISLGEDYGTIELKNNKIVSKGKVTLEEYAKEMSTAYAGISLMISPHPSYPPLEFSTFGIKTITNTFANKDLKGFNDNIVSLPLATPENIANKLVEICEDFNSIDSKVSLNKEYIEGNSFNKVTDNLTSIIKENI